MTDRPTGLLRGLFVSEGPSDEPIAEIVEDLFSVAGVRLNLSRPDYSRLEAKVAKDVSSRVLAGVELLGQLPDVVVAHRDADNVGASARRAEILEAVAGVDSSMYGIPVVPVRMTEAWLLLDEPALRRVAGNPNGRIRLELPSVREAERVADPKALLREKLVVAADASGRQRKRVAGRFDEHRRQLLERLSSEGHHTRTASWTRLVADVADVCERTRSA